MDKATANNNSLLADLISLWQGGHERGETISAAELCRDCPELLPELERQLAALQHLNALAAAHETATLAPDDRLLPFPQEAPTLDPEATRAPVSAEQPATDIEALAERPVIIGYEVLGVLGKGGMGVVYKARQRGLGRIVALKMILHAEHAGDQERQRFQAEAEAVARLQHANIVQVYEVGEQRGLPYFSLEYCSGGSLETKLSGTPLPPREAAQLVQRLAEAMQAAHDKGILHRDLKPANVLLAEDGTPKITDFGLAKKLGEKGQTQTGSILGTPSYMAPEQADGKSKEIGPAADIYALGAILHELLTGRPPFKAATVLDTVLQVLSDEPVPVRRLQPKVPRDLETICLKCLHKEAPKRYASARDLGRDLQQFLGGEAIHARPVGAAERGWRWCRRNLALTAALAAFVVALAGGSIAATIFAIRESASARQAQHEAERAEQNAEQAREAQHAAEQAQSKEAEQRRQAHRQFVDLLVSNGNRLLAQDNPAAALPWFAEAVRQAPEDSRHLTRLNGTLGLVPRPVYLWRHSQAVTSLAVSSAALRAVTGYEDGTARIWDLESGAAVGKPLRNETAIAAVAISADGKRVATAGGVFPFSGEVRIWDETGKPVLAKPIRLPGKVLHLGFSADGKRLTTAEFTVQGNLRSGGEFKGSQLTCRLLDVTTGQGLGQATIKTLNDPLNGNLGYSVHAGTGRVLRVEQNRATVMDLASNRPLGDSLTHPNSIWFARLSADGNRVSTIDTGRLGKIRDLATGQTWDLDVSHSWRPLDAAFNGLGEVALAFYDGTIRRYRLNTGKGVPNSLWKVGAEGWSLHFDDNAVLLTGLSKDGAARVWEVNKGLPLTPPLQNSGAPTCIELAAEAHRLLVGTDDGSVRVWDLACGETPEAFYSNYAFRHESVQFDAAGRCRILGEGRILSLNPSALSTNLTSQPGDRSVRTTVLSPDGTHLAMGTDRGEVVCLDTASLKEAFPPGKHTWHLVLDAVFSPNGRFLGTRATESDQGPNHFIGEAMIWDAATGKAVTAAPLRPSGPWLSGITCIAFSPDSRWFAAGIGRLTLQGVRGEIQLYEAASGKPSGKPLPMSSGSAPMKFAFGSGGRRLAVMSIFPNSPNSCELSIWDVQAGKSVRPPVLLQGEPHDGAVDPSSGRLAIAVGATVHVWDLEKGKAAYQLRHPGEVTAVRYQQKESLLLSISRQGTFDEVHFWDAATGEVLRPPLRHPAHVESVALAPDNSVLVTLGDRDRDRMIRLWRLASGPGKQEERLARLLSCRELDGRVMVPVDPERLGDDWANLRRSNPASLEPTAALVNQWHEQQTHRLINVEVWMTAARQCERLVARQPGNTWWRYMTCSCYLAAGDRDGLRRHAEAFLRLSRDTKNLYDIDRSVKSSLLLPDLLPDTSLAIRLSEGLEKVDPNETSRTWFYLSRGMALYRAGRPAEAAVWLDKARTAPEWMSPCKTLASLFLAMVRAKQERTSEAQKLLSDATIEVGKMEEKREAYYWLDRIHCCVALAEAKRIIPSR